MTQAGDGTPALPPARPPFPVTAPHRVVPAPRPVEGSPLVELDDAWPAALARRLQRLTDDPDGVVVHDGRPEPGLEEAVRQAYGLLPGDQGALPLLGVRVDLDTGSLVDTGPSRCPAATGLLGSRRGLDLLVTGWLLACSDDLVVLRRSRQGVLRTELLAVAFPSGWPPRLRLGASLLELHAPVADGERLQRAAPALSEALLTKGPLRQHVWGLNPDGRLDRDPSAADAPTAADAPSGAGPTDPAMWWLRVERQTSMPLPALDRALFTIRPHLVPLTDLTPAQCATLAAAVASMGPAARAYKAITAVADDAVAWLTARSLS